MGLKTTLRRMTGYTLVRAPGSSAEDVYFQDGLRSVHNHDFMNEPAFCQAYDRGCQAAADYKFHWRVHLALWAATAASKLDGDFVECGVNYGFLSSAIMEFLNWNSLDKTFYLLDTYRGLDDAHLSADDRRHGAAKKNRAGLESGLYVTDVNRVKANFSEWKNTRIIQGCVPETLDQVDTQTVAYLHLDMNCSPPEIAALHFFWDRLVPGAVVLLDDYAYDGYIAQKRAMDELAREKGVMIASLPTGQGLILKPPNKLRS